jgi:hypothetical protein
LEEQKSNSTDPETSTANPISDSSFPQGELKQNLEVSKSMPRDSSKVVDKSPEITEDTLRKLQGRCDRVIAHLRKPNVSSETAKEAVSLLNTYKATVMKLNYSMPSNKTQVQESLGSA